MEAIRGERAVVDIAEEHGLHPNQVALWRKKLLDGSVSLFEDKRLGPLKHKRTKETMNENLYREIGQLAVEIARGRVSRQSVRRSTTGERA